MGENCHLSSRNEHDEVQRVKQNEPTVDQQKHEAFDTWLWRCPEASWSHVRDALHKAGEYTLETKIATNHGLSFELSEEPSRKTLDDTAITCPGTAIQASRDPHGCHYFNQIAAPSYNPIQDPLPGKIDNLCLLVTFCF